MYRYIARILSLRDTRGSALNSIRNRIIKIEIGADGKAFIVHRKFITIVEHVFYIYARARLLACKLCPELIMNEFQLKYS